MAKKRKVVTKVKLLGSCYIHVEGMSMKCPACGVLVESGDVHKCDSREKGPTHAR